MCGVRYSESVWWGFEPCISDALTTGLNHSSSSPPLGGAVLSPWLDSDRLRRLLSRLRVPGSRRQGQRLPGTPLRVGRGGGSRGNLLPRQPVAAAHRPQTLTGSSHPPRRRHGNGKRTQAGGLFGFLNVLNLPAAPTTYSSTTPFRNMALYSSMAGLIHFLYFFCRKV